MTAPELKPCPFCGEKAVTEILIVEGVVFCSGCRATIIRKHEVKEDTGQDNAIAAWNRRADLEPQPDLRDEVIARLVEALGISANRLDWCAVDYETGSRKFIVTSEWADEARAALAAAKAVQK